MKIWDETGNELDANFHVERVDNQPTVLLESRSGTKGAPNARNVDYNPALEHILSRLQSLQATISDILVDSRRVRDLGLPPESRRLALRDGRTYPLALAPHTDTHQLRLAISAAQRSVGRAEGVRHGGGNNTKQIRIYLEAVSEPTGDLELTLAGRPRT